jgi:glucose 1-dehydrogenase
MRLENRTAFVTGADSGIGRAIAITFAREGADVAIHYNSDQRGAEQTASAIREHGRRVEIYQADFSDPANAESLLGTVVSAMGRLDILVNNAGTGDEASTSTEEDTASFVRLVNVDLVAPFILSREAAKLMSEQGSGSIINITSVHEEIPSVGGAGYCAAKGGLRMVTRCLALELAGSNVRINNIGPGMIATPMTTPALHDPQQSEDALSKIPMGRPGDPQEIANTALFLASDEASYVTGSSFFVDGGLRQKVGLA